MILAVLAVVCEVQWTRLPDSDEAHLESVPGADNKTWRYARSAYWPTSWQ